MASALLIAAGPVDIVGAQYQALAGLHARRPDGGDNARALGELRSVVDLDEDVAAGHGRPGVTGIGAVGALVVGVALLSELAGLSLMKLSTSA